MMFPNNRGQDLSYHTSSLSEKCGISNLAVTTRAMNTMLEEKSSN